MKGHRVQKRELTSPCQHHGAKSHFIVRPPTVLTTVPIAPSISEHRGQSFLGVSAVHGGVVIGPALQDDPALAVGHRVRNLQRVDVRNQHYGDQVARKHTAQVLLHPHHSRHGCTVQIRVGELHCERKRGAQGDGQAVAVAAANGNSRRAPGTIIEGEPCRGTAHTGYCEVQVRCKVLVGVVQAKNRHQGSPRRHG